MKFEVRQAKEIEVKDEPTTLELVQGNSLFVQNNSPVVLQATRGDAVQTVMAFREGKFARHFMFGTNLLNISVGNERQLYAGHITEEEPAMFYNQLGSMGWL